MCVYVCVHNYNVGNSDTSTKKEKKRLARKTNIKKEGKRVKERKTRM